MNFQIFQKLIYEWHIIIFICHSIISFILFHFNDAIFNLK